MGILQFSKFYQSLNDQFKYPANRFIHIWRDRTVTLQIESLELMTGDVSHRKEIKNFIRLHCWLIGLKPWFQMLDDDRTIMSWCEFDQSKTNNHSQLAEEILKCLLQSLSTAKHFKFVVMWQPLSTVRLTPFSTFDIFFTWLCCKEYSQIIRKELHNVRNVEIIHSRKMQEHFLNVYL